LSFSITFSVVSAGLLVNPFTKKFLEKWGEEAAEQTIAFSKWLAKSVVAKFTKNDKVLLRSVSNGCDVEFVIDFSEPEMVTLAAQQVFESGRLAAKLVGALKQYGPRRVVYAFDPAAKKWFPKFAVTRYGGVITDQPYLITIDTSRGGLSLGGTRPRAQELT